VLNRGVAVFAHVAVSVDERAILGRRAFGKNHDPKGGLCGPGDPAEDWAILRRGERLRLRGRGAGKPPDEHASGQEQESISINLHGTP
jgi:hypothetical protein